MIQYFPIVTGSLTVEGSVNISGGITASGGISISGSIASASYAASASNALAAQSASYVLTAQTASYVLNAQSASYVLNAQSASNAVSAATASFANNLTVAGTLTAQTLVVQTITSSVDFVTGSTRFGSLLTDTHVFSGSVSMNPGGLFVSGSGLVGIGTNSPAAKLEVNVGLNSLKISGRDTYVDSTEDPTNANIYVTQAGVGDFSQLAGNLVLQARTQGTVYRDIIFAGGLSNGDALMTILGEGNVGIGLTNPTNGKLEIQTGATAAGLWVQTGGTTSDYVIADFRTGTNLSALQILGNGAATFGSTINAGQSLFQVADSGTGTKTLVSTLERTSASPSATPRELGITFKDGNNPTIVGGITGIRYNSSGNFLGGLRFYVNNAASTPATAFSNLLNVLTIDYNGSATFVADITTTAIFVSSGIYANNTLGLRKTTFDQINSGASQTVTIISAPGATAFRSLQVVVIGFEQTNSAIIQLKFDIIARWSGASLVNSGIGNIVANYSRGIGDFVGFSTLTPSIGTSGNSVTLTLTNSSGGYINNIIVNITENSNG